MANDATKPTCGAPGCGELVRCRGHCMTHYVALGRLIKKTAETDNPVTWAALEASGIVPAKYITCQVEFFRHVQAQLDVFEESSQPDNEGETP